MRPNLILGLRLVLNFLKGSAEAVGDLHVVYYFYLHIKWTRNKLVDKAVLQSCVISSLSKELFVIQSTTIQ